MKKESLEYNMPPEMEKLVDQSFIELAGKLFVAPIINADGSMDKKPFPVRFVRGELSMIVILNEQKSLWFTRKNDQWIYDGWEFGDYSKSWLDQTIT